MVRPKKYPEWFSEILPTNPITRDRCKDFHNLEIEDLEFIKKKCNLRQGEIEEDGRLPDEQKIGLKLVEKTVWLIAQRVIEHKYDEQLDIDCRDLIQRENELFEKVKETKYDLWEAKELLDKGEINDDIFNNIHDFYKEIFRFHKKLWERRNELQRSGHLIGGRIYQSPYPEEQAEAYKDYGEEYA